MQENPPNEDIAADAPRQSQSQPVWHGWVWLALAVLPGLLLAYDFFPFATYASRRREVESICRVGTSWTAVAAELKTRGYSSTTYRDMALVTLHPRYPATMRALFPVITKFTRLSPSLETAIFQHIPSNDVMMKLDTSGTIIRLR
jgi:hypothetical protein